MEDVLHLYNLPLDAKRPLICFDERPVQLLGEVAAPLPMKKGQSARFDYEYRGHSLPAGRLRAVDRKAHR